MNITSGERAFHLLTKKGEIAPYVILCGDPGRVPKIAAHLDNAVLVSENREYILYGGTLNGTPVTVASTGIGGPSAAICVEELIRCGAHTFIRVGTSGGIKRSVVGGDLVIASAAVRDCGTSREYLPEGYPAAADFDVTEALRDSARELCDGSFGNSYHIGVVQSKDSFYGETNPEDMPMANMLLNRWEAYVRLGCLTSEMECAAIYAVAAARGARAGAVLLSIWNVELDKAGLENPFTKDTDRAIRCAVNAVKRLAERDKYN